MFIRVRELDPGEMQRTYAAFSTALKAQYRRAVSRAAVYLVDAVHSNTGWSHKIPPATSASVSFSPVSAGVTVQVDDAQAPNAAPINHRDQGGTFRHPVFGNRENWVPQKAIPFMLQSYNQGVPLFVADMEKVAAATAAAAGFM